MEITKEVQEKLKLLNEKYAANGQDVLAYLDGLLYQDYVKYWDYIELDTLLSLQKPRTNFADEEIFIIYHQITELYFKLALNELNLISKRSDLTGDFYLERLMRITRYFRALIDSFEIMSKGMDNKEFMKFRMALLPASGFQCMQYRLIEFHCTDLKNLIHVEQREALANETDLDVLYESVYWKQGAKDIATQQKTLTLLQFEEEYEETFLKYTKNRANDNLWQCFLKLSAEDQANPEIIEELKKLDQAVNVNWPLSHYKSAVRYLQTQEGDVNATGGTNWQKYLPPRFQKRVFFPSIWSSEEMETWGRAWVEEALN